MKLTTRIRALGSPPAPISVALPATPVLPKATKSDVTPIITKAQCATPGRTAPRSPVIVPGTTAQDLLNNVMGTKRGVVDVSPQQRIQPQFPFGLGPNAPPSIWSTSLDQFEPSQAGRQLARQPSPHFQSPQSPSAVGVGYRPSTSLSLGTPQHIPQPPFAASSTLSSPMTQSTEHRQSQWQNSNNVSFVDPAIVSAATPSQPTIHYGGPTSYQGFSNGQYIRPGQHHKSPPNSRIWGIHG